VRTPSDCLSGAATWTIQTRKLEDGRYEATAPTFPQIKPVVDEQERWAIRGVQEALRALATSGELFRAGIPR